MTHSRQKNILFICTANAIRSQIAEALVNQKNNGLMAFSAGIRPAPFIDKYTIGVMKEIGLDIVHHTVNSVDDFKYSPIDIVITLGSTAYQDCPSWLYEHKITDHWGFRDVSGRSKQSFRKLRDSMKTIIDQFISEFSNDLSDEDIKSLLKKFRV